MALEALVIKVKSRISHKNRIKKSKVGVLAFEISTIMSKLIHLWQSLSDKNLIRLRNDSISFHGIQKLISNHESFLLSIACAEFAENLNLIAKSVSTITKRCRNETLQSFDRLFDEFANSGCDSQNWSLNSKEIEALNKKMERYVNFTATLYREIDEVSIMENEHHKRIIDLQSKILWRKQEIKYLKQKSVWNQTFDFVTLMIAKSMFTVLVRIKFVFKIGRQSHSLISSSAVHPSEKPIKIPEKDFFESNSNLLNPPENSLGFAALAFRYANLIITIEKMIKSPLLVGGQARDELYGMLPESVRTELRFRLRGVVFAATDLDLVGKWREAVRRILGWLLPLASNMIRWQSERNFERENLGGKRNVFLIETLVFADREKTEAAITELLVGLNYIWRFERERTVKTLYQSSNFTKKKTT